MLDTMLILKSLSREIQAINSGQNNDGHNGDNRLYQAASHLLNQHEAHNEHYEAEDIITKIC